MTSSVTVVTRGVGELTDAPSYPVAHLWHNKKRGIEMGASQTEDDSAGLGDDRTRWGHVLSGWLVCLVLALVLVGASFAGA